MSVSASTLPAEATSGRMRVGIVFSQADSGTDPAAIRAWAQRAEAAGFDHILAYDHILGASVDRLGPGPFGNFTTAPYTAPTIRWVISSVNEASSSVAKSPCGRAMGGVSSPRVTPAAHR